MKCFEQSQGLDTKLYYVFATVAGLIVPVFVVGPTQHVSVGGRITGE